MTKKIETIVNSENDISSDAEEFYRKYWSETGVINEVTIARKRAIISKFFPSGLSGKKILEIGVGGEGGLIHQLFKDNQVHGLDVSDSAISNCRRFGLAVTKANLDTDAIPFEDDYFDIVIAFEVFEHFCNPQHALEEIRRALKTGGIFISSIPSTFTYHWPRLFYPALFEKENYHDFLIVNGFRVTHVNDWLLVNSYRTYQVPPEVSSWSWYTYAEKLGSNDAKSYFEAGIHFWEKRNEYGIRTKPIEAIDMFKKSCELSDENDTAMLYYAHALIYRAVNNDHQKFTELLGMIFERLKKTDEKNKVECLARVLLIDVEARRLGLSILNSNNYVILKQQLSQIEGTQSYVEAISSEELINQRLAAL